MKHTFFEVIKLGISFPPGEQIEAAKTLSAGLIMACHAGI